MKLSQNDRIERRLMAGFRITQEDADLMYPKIKRLAARIKDLRERYELDTSGRTIDDKRIKTPGGASVSEYWMVFPTGGQGALFGTPNKGRPV